MLLAVSDTVIEFVGIFAIADKLVLTKGAVSCNAVNGVALRIFGFANKEMLLMTFAELSTTLRPATFPFVKREFA